MTPQDFDRLTDDLLRKVSEMRDTKGKEYANSETDRLLNFKDAAEETGVSPLVVWQIYFKKYLRAIDFFIKHGNTLSETIEGRFVDAITYLLLGYGLVLDRSTSLKTSLNSMCSNCIHKQEDHVLTREYGEQSIIGYGSCTKCTCTKYEPITK